MADPNRQIFDLFASTLRESGLGELFTVDAVSHGLPDGLFQTEYSPGVNVFQAQVNWLDSFMVGVPETTSS